MDNNIQLQQSVLQGVASLLDDDAALRRLQRLIARLQKENADKETCLCMDEELDDLRQSLIELKMVKQGKLKSRPVKELLNEL